MILRNETREKTEAIIDILHRPLRGKQVKIRTYRQKAHREYLNFAKKRKHSERAWRKLDRMAPAHGRGA